jgi:ATP-dependent exoDNAse (exonuclease V) alpha subunit
VVAGYAGTGKSTLVRFAIEALDVARDKVAYACYTGKAAEVLRKKGNPNAMTLHKLLYESFPRPGGGFYRKPKLLLDYNIVVVDECSMVPKTMVDLLLSHKVFVIFLGDPFQLDVIDKNERQDLLIRPNIFLTKVMRQAEESEIIRLTMKIRNKEEIDFSKGNEVIVIPKAELNTGHLQWADQVICATNSTRISLNNQMRALYGFGGLPQSGEKFLCLRNYWEDLSDDGEAALVNGMTGIIKNPFETYIMAPPYVQMKKHKMDIINCSFETEEGEVFSSVDMDKVMIETGSPCLDWRESYALGKLRPKIGDIIPRQFTYGYAITGHKAQGCEFDKVLVIEELFPFDKLEHARWLYTACTRSSSKLVLVRN